ncbi:MAG: hypothetical protein KAR33_10540 [Candidatus Thorarchaeota archaeon]|nr:hypothetical protein [Candidatus Thorarchaeota archaeon]
MSSKEFEAGLVRQFENAKDTHEVDVTTYLQMMFESSDRHISQATIRDGRSIVIIAGFRSEILSPFPRYRDTNNESFNQCDIPGLIPVVALLVEQRDKTLAASAIEKDNATRAVLIFKGDSIEKIARNVWRFMDRWDTWTRVLMNILEKDLPMETDWREFLAGESGFITMNWYKPLDLQMRTIALDRVALASKALLQSVLSQSQFENYWVQQLLGWLDTLQPQFEVEGMYNIMVQEEVA